MEQTTLSEPVKKHLFNCDLLGKKVDELHYCEGGENEITTDFGHLGAYDKLTKFDKSTAIKDSSTSIRAVCNKQRKFQQEMEVCEISGDIPMPEEKVLDTMKKLYHGSDCRIEGVHIHTYAPGKTYGWWKAGHTRGRKYEDYPAKDKGLKHIFHLHPSCEVSDVSKEVARREASKLFFQLVDLANDVWV